MLGSLIGVGAAALAGTAAYQAMAPWAQGFGRTFVSGSPGTKQTFRLMYMLARHDVRATFFLIGRYVKQRPDIVRDLQNAGHVLGNHTFTHPQLVLTRRAETRDQLEKCQQVLQDVTGESPRLFRPPFGGRRPATLCIGRALGMEPVMWSINSRDWKTPPAEQIVRTCASKVRGGDVILMHDGSHIAIGADRSQTVIATGHLIQRYQQEGYEFVTVPELMAGHTSAVVGQN
jgi:peptidoglycan/xylan/chitin deacetylase (PgdA/CDA1 family)